MYRLFFLLLILTMSVVKFKTFAQQLKGPQYFHNENYAYKVKQIDEFIDRFNNEVKYFKEGNAVSYTGTTEERKQLIKSLFNQSKRNWNLKELSEFINFVTNEYQPVYISFYDPDWYAEVDCLITYDGKVSDLKLIMKIQINENGGAKWVISGAQADFLQLPEPERRTSIKPSNHNLYFSSLRRVLSDTKNLKNYVVTGYDGDMLTILFTELLSEKIQLKKVKSIKFHFLQLYGWVMVVENIYRDNVNSGWLINSLIKADNWEKRYYKKSKLFLSDNGYDY